MRAPTFATLLLSALILGTASHVQAQGHRHTAPGHRFHDHAPGHAKRWDDIDRRDKRVRWEDRYDRDDRRLPWYVKREPVRARRDYAFERYLWEHRAARTARADAPPVAPRPRPRPPRSPLA